MNSASEYSTNSFINSATASVLSMLALLLLPVAAFACDNWVAKIVSVEGLVQKQLPQQEWQRVQREQPICPGDTVRVGDNSRAALHLRNNTFTRIDANSIIKFPAQISEDRFWVELQQGVAHFISRIVHRFEVATPYVNAVVEGTEFIVSANQQGAVSVMEGRVTAYNEKDRTSLTAGQQATAQARDQDLTRLNVPTGAVVEWAIHYPPILTLSELPSPSDTDKQLLQQAIEALQSNRIDQALQVLKPDNTSSTIQLARAALLLQIGRMAEFDALIATQLQGNQSGIAYGLQSIADVARNQVETGRTNAEEAIKRAPTLAASWIALSYAQQATLQLNDALASARKAVAVQPDSVLAHLRVSEIFLAQGDVDGARDSLEALPANIASSAALEGSKGFVQLFRLKLDSAQQHFNKALALDSSNPQFHLGLGLALLRGGDLEKGRQEMEYAVSLDPLRSVLRSYLGRAYFEEKRDKEAIKQWDLAKQFDPNDPTPYFYTGVHKLFANDPVGAIDELETSRNLNDKRAIYRSETLLQSDAASRSATLARAYNEVGYDQGVLLNGWDALRRDPSNSEGHRLLADTYANDPRFDSARVSELLQSQLWQPLSAYPLQPQLNESDLAVVAGAGPQRPSFNEYHSLFTQDGWYGMANGYVGSDNTWGDDLVGSLLAGPFAVSLGQYHFETDGWRENANQEQDVYDGLVQWQLSAATRIQYEYRQLEWDKGDLSPHYTDLFTDIAGSKVKRQTDRLGVYHEFSGSNSMIVSLVKQSSDDRIDRSDTAINYQVGETDDWAAEMQFSTALSSSRLLYGFGYSRNKAEFSDYQMESFPDVDDDTIFYVLDYAGSHAWRPKETNSYLYWYLNPSPHIYLDFGLAYDRMDLTVQVDKNDTFSSYIIDGTLLFSDPMDVRHFNVDGDRDQWSPKFGVAMEMGESFILRLAAYRHFQRYLTADVTIEPTMFAGFTQSFDDPLATDSKNYGAALDYGFTKDLAFGVSYLLRQMTTPYFADYSDHFDDLDYKMSFADAYLFRSWKNNVTLKIDLTHVTRAISNGYQANSFVSEIDQYALPIALQKSFTGGLSAGLIQTYYRQSLTQNQNSSAIDKKNWVTDLFLRYRLPNRLGYLESGIKNLLDKDDEFVSYNGALLAFYPARFSYLTVNLNF